MPVVRMLELSTAHITQNDAELLDAAAKAGEDRDARGPLIVDRRGEYGWFVPVFEMDDPEKAREIREFGYSSALLQALTAAQSRGCRFLLLDQDADEETGLPTHDW